MVTTRIKGSQIFDGTIKSEDIDDSLEKEFTKVRVSTGDSTPDFLHLKITTSGSIVANVIGISGSAQLLALSGTVAGSNTQVQFNDGGSLGADDGLTFNKSSNTLFVSGTLLINSTSPTYGESFKLNQLITSSADVVRVANYSQLTLTGSSLSPSGDASTLIGSLQEAYNRSKLDSVNGNVRGTMAYAIQQSQYAYNTSWGSLGSVSIRKPNDSNTAGNVGSAVGVYSSIGFLAEDNFSGSISTAYGFRYNNAGINAARTVTDSYGIYLGNIGATAGVTNAIGIDIDQINTASGIKLGIRTQDPIVIGTTNIAGTEKLRVSGTSRFDQASSFILGLSGSLTKLTDGTSYLVAGSGISITSSSNGAITITNDGTVGDITSVTAGTGLLGGGTSGDVTLSVNDSVVATISGSRFTGNVGIKNTGTLNSSLHISGSNNANTSPTLEIEGALIRLGDRLGAQTFSNGTGIKIVDSGVANYSFGQLAGVLTLAQTSNNGDQLFTSDRINILTANATGLIGLGTTPTTARVFISGSSTGTDTSLLIRHGVAVGSNLPVLNVQNSAGTSLLFVSGSGNVGIGTTNPASLLTVQGTATIQGSESSTAGEPTLAGRIRILDGGGGGTAGGIEFKAADSGAGYGFRISNPDLGTGETPLYIQSRANTAAWTNRFTILGGGTGGNTAGNVGIGGEFPRSRFEVTGSGATSSTSTAHFLNSSNTSLLFIRDDGNVGIGTSSPTSKLHVAGTVYATNLSGSLTRLSDGTSYLIAGTNTTIASASNGSITISSLAAAFNGGSGINNNVITADGSGGLIAESNFNFNGSLLDVTGSIAVSQQLTIGTNSVVGSEKLRIVGDTRSEGTLTSVGDILPSADVTHSLGSESQRWQHIYTGDLHLKNERGDWTIIEEENYLTIRNNKTGKRYKINMDPLPELDEEIGKFSTGPAPLK